MTALEQKLLEQLEQEQKLNNTILSNLKNLFQEQNKLIIQNTEKMELLVKTIREQQEIISQQEQKITSLTESLMRLTKELENLTKELKD